MASVKSLLSARNNSQKKTQMKKIYVIICCITIMLLLSPSSYAGEMTENGFTDILDNLKYFRAIHIMAMLLIGFGFLMVFVKKYGRSAITATFLLVSTSLPFYILMKNMGVFGHSEMPDVDMIIFAEFAAASLLITAGAVLGRLKMFQYILLALVFIPAYMLNEWIILEEGFNLIPVGQFADTGGSIVIHAFGALFGLGVAVAMTSKKDRTTAIEADAVSDRFSLLGSMVLWVFWPSFCAAIVPPELIASTALNVIFALCGSTLATYIMSVAIRGKINAADIANAALAGGVAIGSVCDTASPSIAILIGVIAGSVSTFGFAIIQSRLQKGLKIVDTCGVSNLHGIPGILGGLAALFVVSGINTGIQLKGIGITIVVAIMTGIAAGYILSAFGRRKEAYTDAEEFEDAE